jgi:hypothetical protein
MKRDILGQHTDVFKASRRYLDAFEEMQRKIESSLITQDKFVRASVSAAEALRQHGISSLVSQSQREVEHWNRLVISYEQRFYIPNFDKLAQIANSVANSLRSTTKFRDQAASILNAAKAMRTPWLDAQDSMRSYVGFTELQNIGRSLTTLPPFSDELTKTLRENLGDWRHITKIRSAIIADAIGRFDFYRSIGFKDELTDFPVAAFDQSLDLAGLWYQTTPSVVSAYNSGLDVGLDEEELGNERNRNAYDLLLRFETQIRHFITTRMEEIFGSNWVKQRVPGDIYKAWKGKQQTARQRGEERHPLIAYADFSDYIKIIERNDNWKDVFKPIFGRREDVQESFMRLYPIRLCTMHARIITLDDELLMQVETRRILKAIGVVL